MSGFEEKVLRSSKPRRLARAELSWEKLGTAIILINSVRSLSDQEQSTSDEDRPGASWHGVLRRAVSNQGTTQKAYFGPCRGTQMAFNIPECYGFK